MFWIYIWLYTLFISIIWWFFIVIKVHAIKFENFQSKIRKVLRLMSFTLVSLTVLWFLTIYVMTNNENTSTIKTVKEIDNSNIEESKKDIDVNYY